MEKNYNFKKVFLADKIENEVNETALKETKEDEEGDEEEEVENAIIDVDRVSVLATSKQSLKFIKQKSAIDENKKPPIIPLHIQGQLLAFLSAVIGSITTILIKKASLLYPTEQATIRYIFTLVIMLSIAFKNNLKIFGEKIDRRLLLIRGLIGTMGLMFAYAALSMLNPSDFSAIIQSNVIITAILARIYLKEKLTLAHFISVLLTIVGVLLISQPSFIFPTTLGKLNQSNITNSTNHLINSNGMGMNKIGLIIAICDAFLWSGSQIVLKKLCNKKVHFSINNIYTSYIGLPLSLILSCILVYTGNSNLIYNIRYNWVDFKWHLFYSFCVSILGVGNMIIVNFAMSLEEASKLAIIKTTDLFFIFGLQYLFLNIQSDYLNVLGAILILLSSFLIMIYRLLDQSNSMKILKKKQELKIGNENRKSFLKVFYNNLKKILFFKF